MGYDGPKRDWGGLGLEIHGCNVTPNLKNSAGFEPFLPIVPVIKFEFLSTDFFLGGSKDNIKQTTQVNNDNNIKLF